MLFSLLFAPLSHLGIPEFALWQVCIPSFKQNCYLVLLLLVNSKYYLKSKYLTTILCWQGYFWIFKNKVWSAYKKWVGQLFFNWKFQFGYSRVVLFSQRSWALQLQWEETWDTGNAASLLCP